MKGIKNPFESRPRRGDQNSAHLVTVATDIGRTHRMNQDAGGAWTWSRAGTPISLLVVADGVSASPRSGEASRLAVRIISERVMAPERQADPSLDLLAAVLLEAVREAHRRIAGQATGGEGVPPATTIVSVVCVGDVCGGVWCGDSRAYKIAEGGASRLTRDHSWSEEMMAGGASTPELAAQDPRAHMITRYLGMADRADPGIETFQCRIDAGEAVVLCTDGLFNYFEGSSGLGELASTIARHPGKPKAAAGHLITTALRRGGRDNVTVAILERPAGGLA